MSGNYVHSGGGGLMAKIKNMFAGEASDGDENRPSRGALQFIGYICEYKYSFVVRNQEHFCR